MLPRPMWGNAGPSAVRSRGKFMAKINCPCGYAHNISSVPDDGWLFIRDKDYEALIKAELASAKGYHKLKSRGIGTWGRLFECPACGRLMWSPPGDGCSTFKIYTPE